MNYEQSTSLGPEQKYKVVFLGDSGVGKSSVVEQIVYSRFDDRLQKTVGIDFIKKNLVHRGGMYQLMLWDTAGQERFHSLISSYSRGAHCVVLVYDVCEPESFSNCEKWLKIVGEVNEECSIVLTGNKIDKKSQRKMKNQSAYEWSINNRIPYSEVSAKTGVGIEQLISQIVDSIEKKMNTASTIDSEQKVGQKFTKQKNKLEKNRYILKNNGSSCCSI